MVNVGYLTSSDLTDVTDGASLSNKTAHAYNAMRAAHPQVHIAGRYGGYRSAFTQNDMRKASQSPYGSALRAKYGLNPRSSIAVAAHPNGTHEWGDRVDLVGDTIPNLVNIAARYGFHREFGAADPNHFKHDGVTAVSPPAAAVKQVKPGRTIATLTTGKPEHSVLQAPTVVRCQARDLQGTDRRQDGCAVLEGRSGAPALRWSVQRAHRRQAGGCDLQGTSDPG
jgi:hypothetical protein